MPCTRQRGVAKRDSGNDAVGNAVSGDNGGEHSSSSFSARGFCIYLLAGIRPRDFWPATCLAHEISGFQWGGDAYCLALERGRSMRIPLKRGLPCGGMDS